MPKIKYTGDEPYSGTDPGNGHKGLDLQPGATADVSDAKFNQLLEDFPTTFKKARGGKPAGTGATGSDDVKTYAEFEGDELRQLAVTRELEIDDDADDEAVRVALVDADKRAASET